MSMNIARSAPELVINAPNNAERWPPEKNSNDQTRFGGFKTADTPHPFADRMDEIQ
ncbi:MULTISPECIES: hypothetical protein [Tenebrionibacter/Tenebrionicola group]|uniref:Uncharacterized protein n=2 Tax=Tenebrionibacter/Tenebrionicola group TaxID=2969848 RepID=A0A8K0XVX4_9ENTR|nr:MULTISPECIES: hypothetical protein [Tenebrionibacter/Tenebrionicola group]MBK4714436.1 hypothetical protein [Tenebrionibacter intestinalis]MBV5095339.1 hypothetical protein [Tenebrionicola larvae]